MIAIAPVPIASEELAMPDTAARMLDTYPGSPDLDAELLARCLDACTACALTCTQCADACLAEDDVAHLTKCIRQDLDCADLCTATARIVARLTDRENSVTRAALEACAAACAACAAECEEHGRHGMEHCKVCAEQCAACERACRALLDVLA